MTKYAYFPGCSADSTGIPFTLSTNFLLDKVGIELVEIPDWCCCGTSAARLTNTDLGHALPARSLALAEQMGEPLDVLAPCAGCSFSLKNTVFHARQSEQNRTHLEELIGMPYAASAEVLGLLEIVAVEDVRDRIRNTMVRDLGGLKVACYYGCALVRPPAVCAFDDTEDPQSMDGLMALAGAEPVAWAFKTECCGASHQIALPKGSRGLLERIFANAAANGAQAIVTACPLCMLNLDMREAEVNRTRALPFDLPIFYFTELLGYALGGEQHELGLDRHFWPVPGLTSKEVVAP